MSSLPWPPPWESLLSLLLVLLGVGVILSASIVYLVARALLRPPRMTDGKATWVLQRLSPHDVGLPFEVERFVVQDVAADRHPGGPHRAAGGGRITLAAWWVPNPQAGGRCVVILHGYADAKVGALAWAPLLHGLGYNLLLVDLRAHGESGGTFSTGGHDERHDISQLIDELRQSRPAGARQVALFGVSLGAAVAVATATVRAEWADVAGVVMDSPFADYRQAVVARGRAMGMPGAFFPSLTLAAARWMSGADFADVRPAELVTKVRCPVLVIQGDADPLTAELPAADRWLAAGAGHVTALAKHPEEYRRRVGTFLARAFGPRAGEEE